MKLLKIAIVSMLLMIVTALSTSAASGVFDLSFQADINADVTYEFDVWKSPWDDNNAYCISLPASVKNGDVTVNFTGDLGIDELVLSDGMKIPAPAEGVHNVVHNGKSYTLEVMYGSEIPVICINTEAGNIGVVYNDQSHKEPGAIAIIDGDETVYNGGLNYIKGRGNSTWFKPKKPFNIKLDDKTELFGMEANKSWSLLANYTDTTGLRNITCLSLADKAGINFIPQTVVVDLYIDNNYMGMYTLIEKVEIGDGRVDITSLEDRNEDANPDIDIEECKRAGEIYNYIPGAAKYVDIPVNPDDITGGYILEYDFWDRYYEEISGFMTNQMRAVVIKSPEYASKTQAEYIMEYFMGFEDAIRSTDGYNEQGKHYSEYVDVESLVKLYLLNEYTKNHDAGLSSTFFYKEVGEKMYAGPAWDFDLSLGEDGERADISLSAPDGFVASAVQRTEDDEPVIYGLINQRPEIRELVVKYWQEAYSPIINSLVSEFDANVEKTKASAMINAKLWADVNEFSSYEERYNTEVETVRDFLVKRAEYLDKMLTSDNYCVFYEPNGATGEMIDTKWYLKDDTAVIFDSSFKNEGKVLLGWNTKPDGSGAKYTPGEEVEMDKNIILYAQWDEPTVIAKISSFFATLFK